jgi:hypothetical protein
MIPRVIHHVWPGRDAFRAELHHFRRSFFDHHPDWSFFFWREDLGSGVSADVGALLHDPRYTVVVKSDVARFELLRLRGGVYVDTDVECLRPFDDLLGDTFFCGRESDSALCPSVMGCRPGHPFAALAVREALRRVYEAGPDAANARPNEISGPMLLTELARGRDDVTIFDPGVFYPIGWWETDRLEEDVTGAYAKHWWNGKTSPDGWTRKRVFSRAGLGRVADTAVNAIRYDLGGTYARAGYVSVPLVPGRDRECSILELDGIHPADGEVDEFLLVHTLEHVPVTRYVEFLHDMHRKLRVGGRVVVVQTDADGVIRRYASGELSFRSMRATLFTPADRIHGSALNAHQNMWSGDELARDLRAVGFAAETFDAGSWSFDMHDPLYDDDVSRDHGKAIRNLGVRATKR